MYEASLEATLSRVTTVRAGKIPLSQIYNSFWFVPTYDVQRYITCLMIVICWEEILIETWLRKLQHFGMGVKENHIFA